MDVWCYYCINTMKHNDFRPMIETIGQYKWGITPLPYNEETVEKENRACLHNSTKRQRGSS